MEYISSGKPKIMFLGPGCSKAAIPVAEAIHYWNIVQASLLVEGHLMKASDIQLETMRVFQKNERENYSWIKMRMIRQVPTKQNVNVWTPATLSWLEFRTKFPISSHWSVSSSYQEFGK